MKKNLLLLAVLSSFIPFQIQSCTPARAVAGTVFVGAVSMANVYRVHRNDYDGIMNKDVAIGLGVVATVSAGCVLHSMTPAARLARALELKKIYPKMAFPVHQRDFAPAAKKSYILSPFPYADAFKDITECYEKTERAIELIEKARLTVGNDPDFGKYDLEELKRKKDYLDNGLLSLKALPDFQSQYLAEQKVKTNKEMADSASTVATAQLVQAANSFSHHRR